MATVSVVKAWSLADDASELIVTGQTGWGGIVAENAEAFCLFRFSSADVVTFIYNHACDNADTDGKLCVWNDSGVKVKNRLGASKDVRGWIVYGTTDTLVDGASYATPGIGGGFGTVIVGDNEEAARFYTLADGTPTWTYKTANVAFGADTAGKFSIYSALGYLVCKNNLGSSKDVQVYYTQGATVSLADDGEDDETADIYGWAEFSVEEDTPAECYGFVTFDTNDNVNMLAWTNFDNGDTDGALCFFGSGGNLKKKNRLGGLKSVSCCMFSSEAAAPEATDTFVRGINENDLAVISTAPTDADYDYSVLYRTPDGGSTVYQLDADGTWTTTLDPLTAQRFDATANGGMVAYHDLDVSDEGYGYTFCHVDTDGYRNAYNWSDTEFIDEPTCAIAINGGAASTTDRGIQIVLSGNSGADSGAEASMIHEFHVKESADAWADAVVFKVAAYSLGSPPATWTFPWYLSAGDGLKTLQARAYDRAGNFTAVAAEVSIIYSSPTDLGTAVDTEDNVRIAYSFISDASTTTVDASDSDTDFPVENVQDRRLGKAWQGDPSWAGNSASHMIRFAFSQAETMDLFVLKNHNLDSNLLSDAQVFLCGNAINLASVFLWENNAAYKVDLSALIGADLIVHRPQTEYRYWAVLIKYTVYVASYKTLFDPYIGRIALARSSDIWQPQSNFECTYEEESLDPGTLHEMDDLTLEAIGRDSRLRYRIAFSNLDQPDVRTARAVFARVKRTEDMLVLLRPDDIAIGATAPTGSADWTFRPLYCQFARSLSTRGEAADRASLALELMEIVGSPDVYGGAS